MLQKGVFKTYLPFVICICHSGKPQSLSFSLILLNYIYVCVSRNTENFLFNNTASERKILTAIIAVR